LEAEGIMRIAYVTDAIYPYNKGGKEKRLFDISTRLAAMGHDVYIYCMRWWDQDKSQKSRVTSHESRNIRVENGVTLHAISPYYPLYSGERRSIKQAIFFGLSCLKLIREDWDVIDVDQMPYFPHIFTKLVCLVKGRKMIVTWNEVWGLTYWQEYSGPVKGFLAYLVEKISTYFPDKVISISQHTTDKLVNELHMKKPISTISNTIDYDHILKVKPSKEKSDIIFAGRLLKHKNVDILIKAIAEVKKTKPNVKCIIVGEGPEKERLDKLTRDLRLETNIVFKNFFPNHDDLYSLIKSSKVFVLPSSREGFGLVVLEANACGIPVITVDEKDNGARNTARNSDWNYVVKLDAKLLSKAITNFLFGKQELKLKRDADLLTNACESLLKEYQWK
jgi:glycosyltransferase involved in cell wall biosynthesis